MRSLSGALAVTCLLAAPSRADELTALAPPASRPYPYKILDVQPGSHPGDIVPAVEQHLGSTLSPIVVQQVVTSPEGRQFQTDLTISYETAAVSLHTRMSNQPYEAVTLTTATPVLEGRVIGISRGMRQPNAELPEPAELVAQLTDPHGEPSWIGIGSHSGTRVKYVWTPTGQLPPQPQEPCVGGAYKGYQFKQPRRSSDEAECLAVFTMSYKSDPGQSTVSFSLVDHELARLDEAETDRQILKQIESETVTSSDMKL